VPSLFQEMGNYDFGHGWWKSKAKRIQLSRWYGRSSRGNFSPRATRGIHIGKMSGVGVHFKIDATRFDNALRRLPPKMAARIQRKGLRKGLVHWRGILKAFFGRHRSDKYQPHMADHVAVVSRVYKRAAGYLVWGAVGIRKGAANRKQLRRAMAATVAQGAGQTLSQAERDARQMLLPGWRLHFLEADGKTRNTTGTYYFPKAMALGKRTVYRHMRSEIRRIMREMQTA
jgi:hypothetical protein